MIKNCKFCSKEFITYPSRVLNNVNYCSQKCYFDSARTFHEIIIRFWKRVDKSNGINACWPIKGGHGQNHHQLFQYNKTLIGAHRFSWEIHFGEIPKGMNVCHKCDNPPCVNPKHLFIGDDASNMADKYRKGRSARGETHGHVVLTEKQVREIREKYVPNIMSQSKLAKIYKISKSSIKDILKRRTWVHF